MVRHEDGPRRSRSLDSYLWETRAVAALALLALVAGVASDSVEQGFWDRHALLAGLASSVIVVMLTVAVVNETVEQRRRRRWKVLAQYVMLQLVRDARLMWTGVMEQAGLMPPGPYTAESIDAAARAARDTEPLTAAIRALLADPGRRRGLHEEISRFVVHNDEVLGRWAAVMLNTDVYAEVIDRHVELASDVAWIGSLLDNLEPTADHERRRKGRSHPSAQIEGSIDDQRLADRLVTITQLAEQLDRGTLEVALRLVPIEWWAARLGTTAPAAPLNRGG